MQKKARWATDIPTTTTNLSKSSSVLLDTPLLATTTLDTLLSAITIQDTPLLATMLLDTPLQSATTSLDTRLLGR